MNLEVADIQGLVAAGYRRLRSADYLLFKIRGQGEARRWLGELAGRLTTAQAPVATTGLNLALTSSGLQHLGLDDDTLGSFPSEFIEGMATPHRSRMLGDEAASAPGNWRWGGNESTAVDIVLMLFALDAVTLDHLRHDLAVDTIAGLPGEFILGYANEYGLIPPGPVVSSKADPRRILTQASDGSGAGDLGRNGTYMVFRQMRQDVAGFWNFAGQRAATSGQGSPEKLAAKIVGRWPSGAPLLIAPDSDQPNFASSNDFAYHADDADGLRCPVGAHVRRANPRDSLDPAPGTDRSVALVKRHRILRRGREYGPPISSDPSGPRPPLTDDGQERGLQFICLCSNLVRQFEFVQGTWIASPKFAGLYDDADPLVAARSPAGSSFNIPARPFRHRLMALPPFVTVVGGAYFFLPSIRAVRYLAAK